MNAHTYDMRKANIETEKKYISEITMYCDFISRQLSREGPASSRKIRQNLEAARDHIYRAYTSRDMLTHDELLED